MSIKNTTIHHKRVNITLPEHTLILLDRLAEKGDRSAFLDRAVRFYIKEAGRANLEKKLRLAATTRASRDISLAEEWFSVEEELWPKKKNQ